MRPVTLAVKGLILVPAGGCLTADELHDIMIFLKCATTEAEQWPQWKR